MGKIIICPHCSSTFNEDILKQRENEDICPVCGKMLDSGTGIPQDDSPTEEELEHPDLYFYSVDSEDSYEDAKLRDVWCNCISCTEINRIPYDSFEHIGKQYLRLKEGLGLTCKGCGRQFTKLVVLKRPDGWRNLDRWATAYENKPKCPTCGSADIKKISATSKAASAAMWGLLSRKVHKQWHCNKCKSDF